MNLVFHHLYIAITPQLFSNRNLPYYLNYCLLRSTWVHPPFWWGPQLFQFSALCSLFCLSLFCLSLFCVIWPMLPVYLDCSFFIILSVFSNIYLQYVTEENGISGRKCLKVSQRQFYFFYFSIMKMTLKRPSKVQFPTF